MGIFDFLKKNKNIINLHGLSEIYYDNGRGTIQKRYYRKHGVYDGLFNEWYENGELKWDVTYKNGKMVSPSKEFYENGNIKMEGSYKDGSNIPHGTTKAFYRDGSLKGVTTNKDGMQHGLHQEYFESIGGVSVLKVEGQYKDGGKDGIWKVYYASGKLQEQQVWKDGEKDGDSEEESDGKDEDSGEESEEMRNIRNLKKMILENKDDPNRIVFMEEQIIAMIEVIKTSGAADIEENSDVIAGFEELLDLVNKYK